MENITKSRSSITKMFHNVVQKRNPHKSKTTLTTWTDPDVAFVSAVKHIISIKDSEGRMLASAHASTVYAVW